MLAGELKELLKNVPDEREVRIILPSWNGPDEVLAIFDIGYNSELDVEVIMVEEK